MAAFTHDLGMVVFHSALERKWIEEDFQVYLSKLSNSSFDKDLKEAAKLLLELNTTQERELNYALQVRRAVILITADYYRKIHHIRSKEIISGIDQEFSNLMQSFNLKGIPNRFSNVLAEIAYSHGIDFYNVLDRLEYEADGFSNDKMHPRFIACLLRLGDLLDVDDQRFDTFSEKVFSNSLPKVSQTHLEKHAATKHLQVSPSSIEITVDCKTDEVYRVAREWFDWLQKEVENQSREWSNIAPTVLMGMPPTISRGKLKVLYRSVEPKKELMNLRFAISNQKAFEILEGSAIYENTEFVFLRELIQNAIDATKIKIWRVIKSGVYDYAIRNHLKIQETISHDELINKITFPSDLPDEIFENYQIILKAYWNEQNSNNLRIEVQDRGTGISEKDLIRMTYNVGESRNNDNEFIKFRNSMPYWLKPTGAFGVGLQSLFLVTESFIIQTKSENEDPKEIIFVSAKHGEYSKITDFKPQIHEGSKVILDIDKEKFPEIFGASFNIQLIENFDVYSDTLGDIYLHKLKDYILKEFDIVKLLKVDFFNKEIKKPYYKDSTQLSEVDILTGKELRDGNIQVRMFDVIYATEIKRFIISENSEEIGSDLTITFFADFTSVLEHRQNTHLYPIDQYFVRDIPISESFPRFYATTFFSIVWNFQSPESDKILNLSRDKLIKKTARKFNNLLLNDIIPKALKNITRLFEETFQDLNTNESIEIQYFFMELSCVMTGVPINSSPNIYGTFTIPKHIATWQDLTEVRYIDFFKSEDIYIVSKNYNNPEEQKKEDLKQIWSQIASDDKCIVLWNNSVFVNYLRLSDYQIAHFTITEQDNGKLFMRKLTSSKENLIVGTNENAKAEIFNASVNRLYYQRRSNLEPLSPYADVLAVKESSDHFYHEIQFSKHFIISPFKNKTEIDYLKIKYKDDIEAHNRTNIINGLKGNEIKSIVPQNLIDWISNNSSSNQKPSQEQIVNKYAELATDIIMSIK